MTLIEIYILLVGAALVGFFSYFDLRQTNESAGVLTVLSTLGLVTLVVAAFMIDIVPVLIIGAKAVSFIGVIFGGHYVAKITHSIISLNSDYRKGLIEWKDNKKKLLQQYNSVDTSDEKKIIKWNKEMESLDLSKPRRFGG